MYNTRSELQIRIKSGICRELLKEMRVLAMDNNRLYGAAPDLRALRKLEVLWLHNNHLTGKVPENIVSPQNNTKLQELRCRGNYFECHLYHEIALVHSDSPRLQSECVEKVYLNFSDKTEEVLVVAIP